MIRREPPQAVSQNCGVEVNEQADGQAGKSQICNDLRFVNREQMLDRLEFQEDAISDDHVKSIGAVQLQALVAD